MPRLTVRGRLTLVYTTVFAAGGLLLLGLNYAIVADSLIDRSTQSTPAVASTVPDPTASVAEPPPPSDGHPGAVKVLPINSYAPKTVIDRYRTEVLADLLLRSSAVLLGAIGLAALAGRFIARRTLARLHRITETARKLSERDLNQRLALEGPRDELKELGDTFDGMLTRLQTAFDSQRNFAANASHELRTPLAIQRAAVEVPLATGQVPPHLMPMLSRVLDANHRSERLIEGLLLLAFSGRDLSQARTVDLVDVVRRARGMQAGDEDLDIRLELSPALVHGDSFLLEHLVRNLLDNAIRYNVPHGTVEVTTTARSGATELVVSNTGAPLTNEQAGRLFLPFHRGNGQRLSRDGGTGLGLSIVQSIADAHGGTARAVPRPGGGLTVTVLFPEPEATRVAGKRHSTGDGRKCP